MEHTGLAVMGVLYAGGFTSAFPAAAKDIHAKQLALSVQAGYLELPRHMSHHSLSQIVPPAALIICPADAAVKKPTELILIITAPQQKRNSNLENLSIPAKSVNKKSFVIFL